MSILKIGISFGIILIIAGCITTIHPIYTEQELIFDSKLIGTWFIVDPETGKKDEDTWTFKKSDEKSYDLIITEKNFSFNELDRIVYVLVKSITNKYKPDSPVQPLEEKKSEPGESANFQAHLVRLGDFLVLDIFPTKPKIKNTFYLMHMVPVHTFLKISIQEDILNFEMLNCEWFEKMIDQKKIDMNYTRRDDTIILTASTKELQEFVLKYGKDPEAFSSLFVFHRQKGE